MARQQCSGDTLGQGGLHGHGMWTSLSGHASHCISKPTMKEPHAVDAYLRPLCLVSDALDNAHQGGDTTCLWRQCRLFQEEDVDCIKEFVMAKEEDFKLFVVTK